MVAESASLSFRRVDICYNAANGLELREVGSAVLEDCNIFANRRQGNVVWNKAGDMTAVRCEVHSHHAESGILVMENSPSLADFCECKIHSNTYAGVAVQKRGNVRLTHCKISSNCDGVLIQESGHASVKEGEVFNSRVNGLFVGYDHTGQATIINYKLNDNSFKGLFLGSGQNQRLYKTGNTQEGNRGLRCTLPTSVKQRLKNRGFNSLVTRRWAKGVKRNETALPGTRPNPAPATIYESRFDDLLTKSPSCSIANAVLGCGFCQKMPAKGIQFSRCAKCMAVTYCNHECQTKHWKAAHKKTCTPPKAKYPSFIDPYVYLMCACRDFESNYLIFLLSLSRQSIRHTMVK